LIADVELAIGEHGRGLLNGAEVLLPEDTAGVGVKGVEVGAVVDLIEAIAVHGGRGITAEETGARPLDLLLGDSTAVGGVDGGEQTHFRGVEVFFAMADE